MARSLSQSKCFAVLVSDVRYLPLLRRGYAATVSNVSVNAGLRTGGSRSAIVGKLKDTFVTVSKQGSEASSAWGPDPVTGYYRPINHASEINWVELRHMLNHKTKTEEIPDQKARDS